MQTLIMVQNQPENPQSKPRGKKLGKSLKVWEMLLYENGTSIWASGWTELPLPELESARRGRPFECG